MLETAIITLREGLEAALIVTIILTVLRQQGRHELRRWVLGGLVAASLVAVGGVFWIPEWLARWRINEEAYEGAFYLIGSVLVASFLVWLYRHHGWAAGVRQAAQRQLRRRWTGPAFFTLTFLMVFREAVETLVFIAAISFSTQWMFQFMGFVAGLTLAILFGWAFYRGSRWIPFRLIFRLSMVVLIVLIAQFFIAGVHEWIEAGILPGGPTEMALVGPLVNNQLLIFTVLLAVIALVMLVGSTPPASASAVNPIHEDPRVVRRAYRYQIQQKRRWRWFLVSTTMIAALSLTGFYLYTKAPPMEPGQPIPVQHGLARIPLNQIPVGRIVFFEVHHDEWSVRLLAVQVRPGDVRVALDACILCGPKGYYQRGYQVHCRNCASPIVLETIGMEGGCNPIPIPFTRAGSIVQIRWADIRAQLTGILDTHSHAR